MPLLLAVSAIEFPAFAVVMEIALVAFGKISHILFLLGWIVGRGICIGSDGVLLFLVCLGGALFIVVVVAIVVVVIVPEFPLWLVLAGLSLRGQCPLSDGLVSQAYRHALGALERLWVEGSNRVLNLGG